MIKIITPRLIVLIAVCILINRQTGLAQTTEDTLTAAKLKNLSMEELMNIVVTSVSKRPEKLNETASAIQVITGEDIRNSGVKTLAEALKLAANLQVAQVNSSQWAISARGFNNVLANKLLVLIDGRVVYTPMYGGVFWDVQNVMLEDVERIEVISGPGGTMWGANAVNGVINIITKSAAQTQGLYAEVAYGTAMPGMGSIRYGAKVGEKFSYRLYATGYKMSSMLDTNLANAGDQWSMGQSGFRADYAASKKDQISLQGNMYYGLPNPDADSVTHGVIARGDNVVARWNHIKSDKSDFQLQVFYDHTLRNFNNGFKEDLRTYDIDWQNRFRLGQRHVITYGLGFRLMDHWVTNLDLFGFFPPRKTLRIYNLFLQYEIMLVKERLRFTIGSKIEHNTYTAFQFQPNARLTWTPSEKHTVWAAASRAVRNPSRIDRDFSVSLFRGFPLFMGTDSFLSETAIAYELGWRYKPVKNVTMSLSAFYNIYDNIRSAEPGPDATSGFPIIFANGVRGKTYGVELAVSSQVTKWWNLRGGYTFLKKDLEVKPTSNDANKASAESNDPQHQLLIQSNIILPKNFQFGTVLRFVDKLPDPEVSFYAGMDLRIAWTLKETLELSVTGQNLLYNQHTEFIASTPERLIQRSVYGKVTCRF